MRPLVLLVDEHEDTREMYALALSAMGFDIVAAEDGRDAYRRAWQIHPDAIVADLPMPNYEEWQFLQDLKQNARTREIPLVVVSGYIHRSADERTVHDGFDAFFPKPCLPDELAAALRQIAFNGAHDQWRPARAVDRAHEIERAKLDPAHLRSRIHKRNGLH